MDAALVAFNAHDMDGFVQDMAGSVLDYTTGGQAPLIGPKAIHDDNEAFLTIFPDAQFQKLNAFGQGDWVCVQGMFEGTHLGPFPSSGGESIPATGKKVKVPQCMLIKVVQGQIAELHEYFDHVAFLNQLGVLI